MIFCFCPFFKELVGKILSAVPMPGLGVLVWVQPCDGALCHHVVGCVLTSSAGHP